MGHKSVSSSVTSQRPARSAASRGFRQGAGLWFGFFACALGTLFCVVLVITLGLVAIKAVRGSKGLPGGRTLSRAVAQVMGRGPGDAAAVAPAYAQRGAGRQGVMTVGYPSVGVVPAGSPPAVAARWPADAATGVAVNTPVRVTFGGPAMNRGSLTAATLVLRDAAGKEVPARISFNAVNNAVTIDPSGPLSYATTYRVTVRGGAAGVKEAGGMGMPGDVNWSFMTAPPPEMGPGGPILVVTGAQNRFGRYYAEILRAEGLNEFETADLGSVTPAMLAGRGVVVLGQAALTSDQVSMFAGWVASGGHLIAMRPDKQLAQLLGLRATGAAISEQYLRVNEATLAGAGITAVPMQFHGAADVYELDGAAAVAVLQSNATTPTKNPAVTTRGVGTRGGQASAFTYDLATSVVYTRQGNPAWSGKERDGWKPIRSDDLFYGKADGDPKQDWVDLDKVQVPQADEQQRLLANLIVQGSMVRSPLPRFWYLPHGQKAAIVMTGDDHSHGGTAGRFDQYMAAAGPNASVDGWQAVRGTSYMYPTEVLNDSQAAAYVAAGFELAVHVTTFEADWTPASLEEFYKRQIEEFEYQYPSVPTPLTERTHGIVWSDYSTQPKVEFGHRMRFDTNYYYFPGKWVQDRPGLFTGSGFPMRFATAEGEMIDVYQGTTQMTDESGQSYPHNVDVLLDNALGQNGYYGMFVANMHTDVPESPGSDAIVASAQARGVPVVSAAQAMRWLDGRNGSSFGRLKWDDSARALTFTVSTAPGADGLQGMLPLSGPGGGTLRSVRRRGVGLPYRVETVKGITYAFFAATAGEYEAIYAPAAGDGGRPAVAAQLPEGAVGSPGP